MRCVEFYPLSEGIENDIVITNSTKNKLQNIINITECR